MPCYSWIDIVGKHNQRRNSLHCVRRLDFTLQLADTISKRFSVTKFWDDVRASESTLFVYVGEICRYLLAAPPSPSDRNHRIRLIYGNGLRPDVWIPFRDRFGIPIIVELFGATEGVIGFINVVRGDFLAGAVAHHGALMRRRTRQLYVPAGVDYESSEVLRDRNTGQVVRQPWGTGGEVLVAVPNTAAFAGYFENAAATQKKFLKNVFTDGDLYYRSGDALKRDGEGRWYFVDRLGDTFRWRGENVSTAEVSEVLGKFPGVIDANVVSVTVPWHEGRAGCAALLLHNDKVDLQELLR
jgi:acyl-CoA synthetase (AMP-forming)/AMP-acid ligase II